MSIERIKTGVKGFDELVEGGFPKGSFVVVSGRPGSGKTIFAIQFVVTQAMNNNKKIFFISVEQPKEEIFSQAEQFNWNLQELEKSGNLEFNTLNATTLFDPTTFEKLEKLFQSKKFDIVVIDSLTSINSSQRNDNQTRINISKLIDIIKNTGATSIGIAQKTDGQLGINCEFKADGLVSFDMGIAGSMRMRQVVVEKMRKTKVDGGNHDFKFTKNGIEIE